MFAHAPCTSTTWTTTPRSSTPISELLLHPYVAEETILPLDIPRRALYPPLAQNLDSTGKINSLSLIALGLGPKHETAAPKPPAESPPAPEK